MKYQTDPVKKNPLAPETVEGDTLGQTQAPPAFEVAADSLTPPPNDNLGTASAVEGADSLSTHPLDSLGNTGRDSLPPFDPAKKDTPKTPQPPKPEAKAQGKGLIAQKVGLGKANDPKDVYALMYRLEEIGFLTVDDWQAFGADKTSWEANGMQGPFPDCAISKIIKRYQAAIGLKVPDEFIAPGKFTEKALLEGKGGNKKEEPAHPLSPSTQTGNALPPNTPDYECIAKELYEAGQGWGTDEKKIFKNLALIEAGGDQAKKLKETFCKLYDKDLEQFLKDELWDWGWFNEESKALGMLDGKGEEKDAVEEKDETSDIKAPELGGGATWVIKPLISQESFISQAPPSLASGVTTLTLDQLFSYDLKSYGPGQSRDIKKSENWPKHTSWNSKEPWTTYDQALTATHWLGCHNAAIYMAQKAGVKGINNNADWNTKMDESKAKGSTGGAYIDSQLKAGSVVVARVKVTTMHSVLITGKGKDDKGSFFTFLDPGRSHAAGYNYDLNRLYISKEKIKGGDPAYNSYTLMQVRESIK